MNSRGGEGEGGPKKFRGVPGGWGDIARNLTNRIMGTVEAIPPGITGEKHMESFARKFTDVELILMRRDNIPRDEARQILKDLRERVVDGEDPEELLHEIGLEPDYVWDIIG